jgi:hypothetical protein
MQGGWAFIGQKPAGFFARWRGDGRDGGQALGERRAIHAGAAANDRQPPGGAGSRGEEFCDAATKTHINDNPCYYYSYAIATVLKFQFNDYIAKNLLSSRRRTAIMPGTSKSECSCGRCSNTAAPATGARCSRKPLAKT